MEIEKTHLKNCLILKPRLFNDNRGYFFESFNQLTFNSALGFKVNFVQDNESFSTKGVLRGLHFQKGAHAQAKLVRVIKGKVLDVAVDLREDSKTYGQHVKVELSESNKKQLFVPRGFAHGFVVLSDEAIFNYKCDNFYDKNSESGIRYDDPNLSIDWGIDKDQLIISDKDLELPNFRDLKI